MKGIILASFGTTHLDALEKSIHKVLRELEERYPDYYIAESFSSEMVRSRNQKKNDAYFFNMPEALQTMESEGVKEVYVMSLYVLEGVEYEKIINQAKEYNHDNRLNIKFSKALLSSEEDYRDVAAVLHSLRKDKENLVLMGHGSYHEADIVYENLQKEISKKDKNIFVGTVEGKIGLEDILEGVRKSEYKKTTIAPFLLVAGDHAKEDMSSDEEDSWATALRNAGNEVCVDLTGLCERDAINELFFKKFESIL